jgi:hypothetical protein
MLRKNSMNQPNLKEIKGLLEAVAIRMKTEIHKEIVEGKLKPGNDLFIRTEVPELTINESGVRVPSKSKGWVIRESWLRGNNFGPIFEKVKKSEEFQELGTYLTKLSERNLIPINDIRYGWIQAMTFENAIFFVSLPDSGISEKEFDTYISSYANYILGNPFPFWLEAHMRGILILSQNIEIQSKPEERFYLRQITARDFEMEQRGSEYLIGNEQSEPIINSFFEPSAVLRIECIAKDVQYILNQTRKVLVILRLFKTGGVRIASHKVKSGINHYSSGPDFLLSIQTLQDGLDPVKEYKITDSEAGKFKDFWQIISERLPENIYKIDKPKDPLGLAYERYCDALLRDNLFEKKVASAIMGLEALFLPTSSHSELIYRLSMNTGKIMGAVGENALEVKENMEKAYSIRSTYAHGGKVSKKEEEKIKEKFGSTINFILIILGYLRISILVFIFLGITKDALQRLLEEAMLEEAKEYELLELLEEVKKYV